jgi:protein phosphatase 1A
MLMLENASWDRLETRDSVEESESGSTATVLFARPDRLVLAYVGDSRVVG